MWVKTYATYLLYTPRWGKNNHKLIALNLHNLHNLGKCNERTYYEIFRGDLYWCLVYSCVSWIIIIQDKVKLGTEKYLDSLPTNF